MAGYDDVGRAYLTDRDAGNVAIGFLDGLGDLAVFAATAVPHIRRAYLWYSLFIRLIGAPFPFGEFCV